MTVCEDEIRNLVNNKSHTFLSSLLLIAGFAHLSMPKPFDKMVPSYILGSPRFWTYISGIAELIIGIGLSLTRTRKIAAYISALLFVAVFPANIQMALNWRKKPLPLSLITWLRLPLQLPLVWIAIATARKQAATQENYSLNQ